MNPEMAKELFIRINIICGTFGNTSVLPADVLKKFKSKYLQWKYESSIRNINVLRRILSYKMLYKNIKL